MSVTFTQNTHSIADQLQAWIVCSLHSTFAAAWELTPSVPLPQVQEAHQGDPEFERQKQAFLRIPAENLERYNGRFVVSLNGEIIDDDNDLSRLTNRVFAQGKISVYITRIGKPIRMPSPFVR